MQLQLQVLCIPDEIQHAQNIEQQQEQEQNQKQNQKYSHKNIAQQEQEQALQM